MNHLIENIFTFSPADFRGETQEDSDRTPNDYGSEYPKTEDEQEFERQSIIQRT